MKILIITTEFGLDGGGLSLSCNRLADLLSKDHIVEVINSSDTPITTAHGGMFPQIGKSIEMEFKLKIETEKHQGVDIVIGFGGKFNGYYASLLAKQIKARYVLCLRGSDVNLSKWSIEDSWFLTKAAMAADNIVCLSKEMKRNVLLATPSADSKIVIIPNAIEDRYEKICFPNLPSSIVLGCAASHLNEKKGIANLLCMLSEFKKISEIPIKLVLVGDIDKDLKHEYIQYIDQMSLQNNVVFHDKTSRANLVSMMDDWDFYIQGSVCEGIPNSITEALQCGCAFISTNTGYTAETLSVEYPNFFFTDLHPSAMANTLLKLVSFENKEYMYLNAYKKLQQYCNKGEIIEKWNQLFHNETKVTVKRDIEHIVAIGLHDIQGTTHDSITTPIPVFKKFVEQIYLSGYGLCSMKDYLEKKPEKRRQWIVCTFDDGYKGLNDYALPILLKYGFTATVFICTGQIGKDNKWNNKDSVLRQHLNMDELQNLYIHGWEISSHGVSHTNLLKLTDEELINELKHSRDFITSLWGEAMTYAYPYGAYNDYVKSCVGKYYRYAFSVTQGGTSIIADSLQIRRYSITEIYKMLSIEL